MIQSLESGFAPLFLSSTLSMAKLRSGLPLWQVYCQNIIDSGANLACLHGLNSSQALLANINPSTGAYAEEPYAFGSTNDWRGGVLLRLSLHTVRAWQIRSGADYCEQRC
ncbi:hypothetical protein BD626DRAFT_115107 [Schizophyllum amplum]|uniref:Uncharacterized protein n=1 Tax=Schizophyllum amplum TaxID=97359 RepID=A0A550CUA8_9AGAR|nr:hypothetical protein BD626DRAFT_115107 [Auriculariopsis ampla]